MTRKVANPIMPSEQEIAERCETFRFRNWCRHCVRGRGAEMPHRKSTGNGMVPEVLCDFAFVGEENRPGETLPVLMERERLSKITLATAAPSKSTGTFFAKRVVASF